MRTRLGLTLVSALIAALALITPAHADDTEVNIPDTYFKTCITKKLGVSPHRAITRTQMATITGLTCEHRDTTQIRSLTGWEWLTNIRTLKVAGQNLATTTAIPNTLTQLQTLELGENKLTELTIPNTLTQLQHLDLSSNQLADIRIPNTLTQLRVLYLGFSKQLTTIVIPDTLTRLERLSINEAGLVSITIPDTLTKLQNLHLYGNQLTSITIPDTLTNLEDMYVNGNQLTSITIPDTLTNLRGLYLSSNPLSNITIPGTLTNLENLHLSDNRLASVEIPDTIINLKNLYLESNQLTALTLPAELYDLQYLELSNNRLTSLALPEDLYSLKHLGVSSNRLTSITIPDTLTNLEYMYANENQLTNITIPRTLTKLHLDVSGNQIADLSPLSWLGVGVWARDQRLTFPDIETGTPYTFPLRDKGGQNPLITPDSGATISTATVTYTKAGTHTLKFDNGREFSGTITQKAFGSTIPTAPTGNSGVFGDHTGDGIGDLFAIDKSGQLRFYIGSKTGNATYAGVRGSGWGSMTYLTQIDDITGDKRSDLLARRGTDQSLWVYRSTGGGNITGWKQMGRNWGGMDQIVPAGNLAGGTTQYVVARRAADGALFRYTLTPNGLTNIKHIGQNWGGMKQILSVGDFNGDRRSDILAIRNDGTLWSYLGTPTGTIGSGRQVGRGWNGFTRAFTAGDHSGDKIRDLIGQRADGAVFTYTNKNGSWGTARQILTSTQTFTLMA